jgi:aldehyde:ferredoxin oxidoreductase
MVKGYNGKILRVDLTTSNISVEEPDENFYRRYFGGSGFISYYLLKELKGGEDPLGPENRLIFATGPLTGVPVSGTGRNSVGAKSPLTNGHGNAEVGGFWGSELKHAGYDAIVIVGKAKSPVYLWIEDGKVEIRDARHIWGKTTKDCQDILKQEHGNSVRVCQIGIAGENLVRYACIVNDLNHAAGRSGMGAVMGSKNLRAIAVRGHQKVAYADEVAVTNLIKTIIGELKTHPAAISMAKNGTPGVLMSLQATSGLPTRNFQQGQFEGAEKLSAAAMQKTIWQRHGGCYACTVRCKPEVIVGEPYNVIPEYGGPEYETLASLGSNCGIDNLPAIAKGNQLCTAYGLDSISVGVSIAFAMECFERGILTEKDTNGLKLNFCNSEVMLQLLEMIAHRKGLGNILAEGTERAARKIGKNAIDYAMQVKWQELPMHEPRLKVGLGIGYAISPTGADHCHNLHDTAYVAKVSSELKSMGIFEPIPAQELSSAKVRLLYYSSNWQHVLDCLVFCQFIPLSNSRIVELIKAVTGWNTNLFELMKISERYITMARVYNIREGKTKNDDYLPKRFFTAFETGPLKDKLIRETDLAQSIETYYGMAGWDKNGVPTAGKLAELGIDWVTKV